MICKEFLKAIAGENINFHHPKFADSKYSRDTFSKLFNAAINSNDIGAVDMFNQFGESINHRLESRDITGFVDSYNIN